MKKNKAMSFSELMIVLAIIGAIAALSLPGLKKYSQRAEFSRLAQKGYSNIEQALDNAILTHGPIRNWSFTDNAGFLSKYITPNIKHTESGANTLTTYDGMMFSVSDCDGHLCIVNVDVNGDKQPNAFGKDKFKFQVFKTDEKVVPHPKGVERHLREHDWRFSDTLWNCATAANYDNSCSY